MRTRDMADMTRSGRRRLIAACAFGASVSLLAALVLAAGCQGILAPSSSGETVRGIMRRNVTGILVPAPDGAGGNVRFPGPGDPEWKGQEQVVPISPPPGDGGYDDDLPPPPPTYTPIPTPTSSGGGVMPTFRGLFLVSVGGSFDGNLTPLTAGGVPAVAAGVLIASRTANSGSGHIEMIMGDASGTVWDVVGLGELTGNSIVADRFLSSATSFALGGYGATPNPAAFVLDAEDPPEYTVTDPVIAGRLDATLSETRENETPLRVTVNVRTRGGRILNGTFSGSITASARVGQA